MTSVRTILCPECDAADVTSEPLEKNQHALNVKAKLKCGSCGYEWEGSVSNPDRRNMFMGLPMGGRRK